MCPGGLTEEILKTAIEMEFKAPINVDKNGVMIINAGQKAILYEEIHQTYLSMIKNNDQAQYSLYKEIEQFCVTLRMTNPNIDLLMLLYAVKRVLPTLSDTIPLKLLLAQLRHFYKNRVIDLNFILSFMQIAAFRWSLAEKQCFTHSKTKKMRDGNKFENKEENIYIVLHFFEIYRAEKLQEKDAQSSFQKIYKNKIVPDFIHSNNIIAFLKEKKAKNAKKNKATGIKSRTKSKAINGLLACYEALEKYEEKEMFVLQKLPDLKKKIQDAYRRWKKQRDNKDVFFYSETVNHFWRIKDLKKTLWKKQHPWPFDDVLGDYYPDPQTKWAIILMQESILYNQALALEENQTSHSRDE